MRMDNEWFLNEEMQMDLGFVEVISFITPTSMIQKSSVISQIENCLEENLENKSLGQQVTVLLFIQKLYEDVKIIALKSGVDNIPTADCCDYIVNWINKKIEVLEDLEKKEVLKSVGKKKVINPISKKDKEKTLKEIWMPDFIKQYDIYIDYLLAHNSFIGTPFVKKINGKLHWDTISYKGWSSYVTGFLYTCIKHKCIAPSYSGPILVKIVENTFNVIPDINPLKSLSVNPPSDKYLLPFKSLPSN